MILKKNVEEARNIYHQVIIVEIVKFILLNLNQVILWKNVTVKLNVMLDFMLIIQKNQQLKMTIRIHVYSVIKVHLQLKDNYDTSCKACNCDDKSNVCNSQQFAKDCKQNGTPCEDDKCEGNGCFDNTLKCKNDKIYAQKKLLYRY